MLRSQGAVRYDSQNGKADLPSSLGPRPSEVRPLSFANRYPFQLSAAASPEELVWHEGGRVTIEVRS